MKKACVLLAAVVACAWTLQASAGETLDRVKKNKVLVNVLDQSYPPFSFLNGKNQMDGFDVDVAKEFAKRLGVSLKIETPSWEVITGGRWRGRWDICICSMTPDKQRAQVLDFVSYYYNSPVVVVAAADNAAIKKTADINGKRVGAQQGGSYERYLNKNLVIDAPGAKPLTYPFDRVTVAPYADEDLAFQDLALGAGKRLDAVVANYVTTKARLDKAPGKFKIIGEPLYLDPNVVAVDKGDAAWNAEVVRIMNEMKKDGTLTKISMKWVGRDITN